MEEERVLSLDPGASLCIVTSSDKRYVVQNKDGALVIVSWYEPLYDSRGRQFELKPLAG